jgi:hypothetical protein
MSVRAKVDGGRHTIETLKATGKVTYEPNDFVFGTCWIWNSATVGKSPDKQYGCVGDTEPERLVHRLVFLLTHGRRATPQAAHSCGRSRCFNPDHIYEATQSQNEADKMIHGTQVKDTSVFGDYQRNKDSCPQGHPYDEDNTYVDPKGGRRCRTCHREEQR